MSVCPVCGCKTDDIDFVDCAIGGKSIRVCSFCDKQLLSFAPGKTPAEAQKRWLDSVIAKEFDGKNGEVTDALTAIKAGMSSGETETYGGSSPDNSFPAFDNEYYGGFSNNSQSAPEKAEPDTTAASAKIKAQPDFTAGADAGFYGAQGGFFGGNVEYDGEAASADYVRQLEERVAKLEKAFNKHRKMQILKDVLEVVLPVMLFLIILLVFFTSGLYDTLKSLLDMSGMLAKASPIITLFTER